MGSFAALALGFVAIVTAVRTMETLGFGRFSAVAKIGILAEICIPFVLPRAPALLGKPREFFRSRGFFDPRGLETFQQIHFQTGKVLGLIFLTHNYALQAHGPWRTQLGRASHLCR